MELEDHPAYPVVEPLDGRADDEPLAHVAPADRRRALGEPRRQIGPPAAVQLGDPREPEGVGGLHEPVVVEVPALAEVDVEDGETDVALGLPLIAQLGADPTFRYNRFAGFLDGTVIGIPDLADAYVLDYVDANDTIDVVVNTTVHGSLLTDAEVVLWHEDAPDMWSELGRATIVPYTASKGAVKMFTKGLATEWGKHGVRVNGIGPGYFATEMNTALVEDKAFSGWVGTRTPLARWGCTDELIGAAVFLASDASSFVTGHILYVDGGMSACV